MTLVQRRTAADGHERDARPERAGRSLMAVTAKTLFDVAVGALDAPEPWDASTEVVRVLRP